jgi:putative inorganic carbon (hco3(-)) transporter
METIKKTADNGFDSVQMIVLLIVSPLFIFPKPHYWWIFLIIPILWISRKLLLNRFIEPTPIDLPIFIFLIALFVTTIRVADFSYSLPKIAGVLFAISFFYGIIALLKTEKWIQWSVSFFMAGGFLFSLIGLLGMPTFKEKHLHFLMNIKDKIPQLNFNLPGAELGFAPTVVGGILLLAIPLFLVMTFITNGWKRVLLILGLLTTGGVLLLTQSRGAWIGLFASAFILLIPFLFQLFKKKKIAAILVSIIMIITVIGAIGFYTKSDSNQLKPGIKQAEGTMLFRVQLWDLAIPIIREHPLWGIGLNNFRTQVPEVRFFLSHAHNQFIHIAAEMGIPASIAFMAILIGSGFMCVQVWRRSQNSWIRMASLGLGWGQLAHLFFCLTDAIPPGSKIGIMPWISLGLITAIYKNQGALFEKTAPPYPPEKAFDRVKTGNERDS